MDTLFFGYLMAFNVCLTLEEDKIYDVFLIDSHPQQSSPSNVPQTARQRLAKLTASLIGVGNSDTNDNDAEYSKLVF